LQSGRGYWIAVGLSTNWNVPGQWSLGLRDVEQLRLESSKIEEGLLRLFLLRHLPLDPVPQARAEDDPHGAALLREHDLGVLARDDADVALPHRAPARELHTVHDTEHRGLQPRGDGGTEPFVRAQAPPANLPHAEAQGHIHPEVPVEGPEGIEFGREVHRW